MNSGECWVVCDYVLLFSFFLCVRCHSIVGLGLCLCGRVVSLWNSGDGLCGAEGRVVSTVNSSCVVVCVSACVSV